MKTSISGSGVVLFVKISTATEESAAKPQLQILVRCHLSALQPRLFNAKCVIYRVWSNSVELTLDSLDPHDKLILSNFVSA